MINLQAISRSRPKPPRIIVHGEPGVGKTTFACEAPAPIVIQTEDGLGTLDVPAFPLATSYDDVMQAIGALFEEEHKYETLVLDSLDWLEPLVWAKTCEALGVKSIEAPGYGKGYVEASLWWSRLLQGVTALRDQRGMAVVMTAHSQIVRVEDPLLPSYDRHDLKMHKRASALAEEYADVILFATWQTHAVTEAAGFNQKRTRAITTGERIMHTVGQPAFLAKNRYGLATPLPLSWPAFVAAMVPQPQQAAA
jgi:hypothetical protein